jgi:alkylated DNA nucleotide flippase Atl1
VDKEQMRKQAQILRNKRLNPQHRAVINAQGFIKLAKPLPKKSKNVSTSEDVRILKAEQLLEQRKNLQNRKTEQSNASNPVPPKTKGCAGCRRKTK